MKQNAVKKKEQGVKQDCNGSMYKATIRKISCLVSLGAIVMSLAFSASVIKAEAAPKTEAAPKAEETPKTEAASKTGKSENRKLSDEQAAELIAFIKEKADAGKLETEEDIRKAIKEGEKKFQITLTEKEKKTLISAAEKLKGLGLSSEDMVAQAEKLYDQYGAELINEADEAITAAVNDAVTKAATGFWNELKKSVSGFFKNFLSGS